MWIRSSVSSERVNILLHKKDLKRVSENTRNQTGAFIFFISEIKCKWIENQRKKLLNYVVKICFVF